MANLPVRQAARSHVGDRIVGDLGRAHACAELGEALDEQLLDHTVLATETRVHVHGADAGLVGDAAHRQRAGSFGRQQVAGRLQQLCSPRNPAAPWAQDSGGGLWRMSCGPPDYSVITMLYQRFNNDTPLDTIVQGKDPPMNHTSIEREPTPTGDLRG